MNLPSSVLMILNAGIGKRANLAYPKQYHEIHGKPLIIHTLACFSPFSFKKVIIVCHQSDRYWCKIQKTWKIRNIQTVWCNSHTRAESLVYGLAACRAHSQDWIWVHDSARPCVQARDCLNLYQSIQRHAIGGILGYPLHNSLKIVHNNQVLQTIPREKAMWQSVTPQIFRYGILRQALHYCHTGQDESQAIEEYVRTQHLPQPLMIQAHCSNIKLTCQEDIEFISFLMAYSLSKKTSTPNRLIMRMPLQLTFKRTN